MPKPARFSRCRSSMTGQPPVATPQAYRQAVKVLFPVPVVLDQVDHSGTLAPTLEIRNTSDDTLGIVYL